MLIVCDIDGTLADLTHRRQWVLSKPKNWKAFYSCMDKDPCHDDILRLIRIFYGAADATIILCSGRPEREGNTNIRKITEDWLDSYGIPYTKLFMRKEKDYRADDIVKVEILKNDIIPEYGKPDFWIDDRDRVVKAIRAEGIRVLQVADGDF